MSLPWYKISENVDSKFTLMDLKNKLDRNHYGLEKVKEKIIEYFVLIQNVNSEVNFSIKNDEDK